MFCIVLLHFSNFCFSFSSVADFSNTGARVRTSAGRALFLPARRVMQIEHVVHGSLSMALTLDSLKYILRESLLV